MISPQGVSITAGGIRRKRRSPYIDMIRGQYGQATQNVIQQRADEQRQEEVKSNQQYQQQSLDLAKQEQALARRQQRLQEKADKRAGQFGLASTIMEGVNTGVNLYNATNGFGGLGGFLGEGIKKYGSRAASGLSSIFGSLVNLF